MKGWFKLTEKYTGNRLCVRASTVNGVCKDKDDDTTVLLGGSRCYFEEPPEEVLRLIAAAEADERHPAGDEDTPADPVPLRVGQVWDDDNEDWTEVAVIIGVRDDEVQYRKLADRCGYWINPHPNKHTAFRDKFTRLVYDPPI